MTVSAKIVGVRRVRRGRGLLTTNNTIEYQVLLTWRGVPLDSRWRRFSHLRDLHHALVNIERVSADGIEGSDGAAPLTDARGANRISVVGAVLCPSLRELGALLNRAGGAVEDLPLIGDAVVRTIGDADVLSEALFPPRSFGLGACLLDQERRLAALQSWLLVIFRTTHDSLLLAAGGSAGTNLHRSIVHGGREDRRFELGVVALRNRIENRNALLGSFFNFSDFAPPLAADLIHFRVLKSTFISGVNGDRYTNLGGISRSGANLAHWRRQRSRGNSPVGSQTLMSKKLADLDADAAGSDDQSGPSSGPSPASTLPSSAANSMSLGSPPEIMMTSPVGRTTALTPTNSAGTAPSDDSFLLTFPENTKSSPPFTRPAPGEQESQRTRMGPRGGTTTNAGRTANAVNLAGGGPSPPASSPSTPDRETSDSPTSSTDGPGLRTIPPDDDDRSFFPLASSHIASTSATDEDHHDVHREQEVDHHHHVHHDHDGTTNRNETSFPILSGLLGGGRDMIKGGLRRLQGWSTPPLATPRSSAESGSPVGSGENSGVDDGTVDADADGGALAKGLPSWASLVIDSASSEDDSRRRRRVARLKKLRRQSSDGDIGRGGSGGARRSGPGGGLVGGGSAGLLPTNNGMRNFYMSGLPRSPGARPAGARSPGARRGSDSQVLDLAKLGGTDGREFLFAFVVSAGVADVKL